MSESKTKIKPTTYKKKHRFDDGSLLKEKYFANNKDHYIIYKNENNEVKYKCSKNVEIEGIEQIIAELSIMPRYFKTDLNLHLAKIYDLALSNNLNGNKELLSNLESKIQNRNKIIKKISYLLTPTIIIILYYLFYFTVGKNIEILKEYATLPFFTYLGSFITIVAKLDSITFESGETSRYYIIFSIFKFIIGILSSIMLIVFYKSGVVNLKIDIPSNYLISILSSLGGYSEKLVPNIFENISKKINK